MTSSLLKGGAAASAEAAGGARGRAEEAEGGESQRRRERWEPSGNIVSGLLILQTGFKGLDK